jgi:hypothetical protein
MIALLRMGISEETRRVFYDQFIHMPLYEDMAPWNISTLPLVTLSPAYCGVIFFALVLFYCIDVVRNCGVHRQYSRAGVWSTLIMTPAIAL